MELNSFLNLKDNLRIYYTKIGFKLKIIEKKIYVLKGKDITLVFFYQPQKKYMKVYYIDSFNFWIYQIRFYKSDDKKAIFSRIKNYIKRLEYKKNELY